MYFGHVGRPEGCRAARGLVPLFRMIKDATVKRYHCDSHDKLRAHLQLFVDAYTMPVG